MNKKKCEDCIALINAKTILEKKIDNVENNLATYTITSDEKFKTLSIGQSENKNDIKGFYEKLETTSQKTRNHIYVCFSILAIFITVMKYLFGK